MFHSIQPDVVFVFFLAGGIVTGNHSTVFLAEDIAHLNNPAGITGRQQTVTGEMEKNRSVDMRLKTSSMILNYTGSEKQPGVVQLLNIDGQLIRSYKVTLEKGRNSLELNTGALAASTMYIGVLTAGGQKYSVKMVK